MKLTITKLLAVLPLQFLTLLAFSQCLPGNNSATLDINNVKADFHSSGDMWWDLNSNIKYEVPAGSGIHALFAGNLWIGGKDDQNNLLLAGHRYQLTGTDFFPGALDSTGALVKTCDDWDKVFEVTLAEVQDFVSHGILTPNIENWPAKGNSNAGMPNQPLAPFVDINGDEIYNPNDGDYPDIKGDKALWLVYNDVGNLHTETGGGQIGVEVQLMIYAYADNTPLNNTIFYDYTVTKKSTGILYDTYFGFFVDGDLGNYGDDYTSCHSTKRLGIIYNGDGFDEDGSTVKGYGDNPPAVAYKLIKTPMQPSGGESPLNSFLVFSNTNGVFGVPSTASEFYNVISGNWKDGQPISLGGDGRPTANSTPYPFLYDQALDTMTWNECTVGNNASDRSMLMSVGSMALVQNQSVEFTSASIWNKPAHGYHCSNLDSMVMITDQVDSLYKVELANSPISVPHQVINNLSIGPNPSYGESFINNPEGNFLNIKILNNKGQLVQDFSSAASSIPISDLSTGLYTIRVQDQNSFSSFKLMLLD